MASIEFGFYVICFSTINSLTLFVFNPANLQIKKC